MHLARLASFALLAAAAATAAVLSATTGDADGIRSSEPADGGAKTAISRAEPPVVLPRAVSLPSGTRLVLVDPDGTAIEGVRCVGIDRDGALVAAESDAGGRIEGIAPGEWLLLVDGTGLCGAWDVRRLDPASESVMRLARTSTVELAFVANRPIAELGEILVSLVREDDDASGRQSRLAVGRLRRLHDLHEAAPALATALGASAEESDALARGRLPDAARLRALSVEDRAAVFGIFRALGAGEARYGDADLPLHVRRPYPRMEAPMRAVSADGTIRFRVAGNEDVFWRLHSPHRAYMNPPRGGDVLNDRSPQPGRLVADVRSGTFRLAIGEITRFEVPILANGSVAGQLPVGTPGRRSDVVLTHFDEPALGARHDVVDLGVARPGADGAFRFDNVLPGRTRVTARWEEASRALNVVVRDFVLAEGQSLDLGVLRAAGATLDVDIALVRVDGTPADVDRSAVERTPVRCALVRRDAVDGSTPLAHWIDTTLGTTVRVTGLAPGEWAAHSFPGLGGDPAMLGIDPPSALPVARIPADVRIVVPWVVATSTGAGRMRIELVTSMSEAGAEYLIHLAEAGGASEWRGTAGVAADGRIELESREIVLADGTYTLRVVPSPSTGNDACCYHFRSGIVVRDGRDVDLHGRLENGCTVTGRLGDDDAGRARTLAFEVESWTTARGRPDGDYVARIDGTGRFEVRGVPLGARLRELFSGLTVEVDQANVVVDVPAREIR